MNINKTKLENEVVKVLKKVRKNPGTEPYITAYQVLSLIDSATQNKLIHKYSYPGKRAGKRFSSASRVMTTLKSLAKKGIVDEIESFSTIKSFFIVNNEVFVPGNQNVGLYRLKRN